jgi:hypothetical protein
MLLLMLLLLPFLLCMVDVGGSSLISIVAFSLWLSTSVETVVAVFVNLVLVAADAATL